MVKLPQLYLGEKWLGQVSSATTPIPVIDKMLDMLNSKATIFQPLPDGSGLLRVATNVINAAGN